MELEKASPKTLVDAVVEQLEKLILDGGFGPGDRLPPFQEMQDKLGVGRNTLREALSILNQKGLIEVRQGSTGGTFIRELGVDPFRDSLDLLMRQGRVPWRELIEFRLDLDGVITRRAVMAATEEDKAKLKEIVAQGEVELAKDEPDWRRLIDLDQQIHHELARMSRNTIHEWMMRTVLSHMHNYFDVFVLEPDEFARKSFKDMAQVVKSLVQGDVERTVALGQAHALIGYEYFEDAD